MNVYISSVLIMFPSLSAHPTNFIPSLGLSALIVMDEPTATFSLLPEPFEITTFTFFSSSGIDNLISRYFHYQNVYGKLDNPYGL